MKISEICDDFVPSFMGRILSEVVDTGHPSSDRYYALGEPLNIHYTDEDGVKKSGMVILCPRCGGKGDNTSKTLSRLHGTHITQSQADKFGGGCHTKRQDAECVGGFMRDRRTGMIIWPATELPKAKEKGPATTMTVDEFMSGYPAEYALYLDLKSKYESGTMKETDEKLFTKLDGDVESGTDIDVRYVQNWLAGKIKAAKKSLDPNAKYQTKNTDKGQGKLIDRRRSQNEYNKRAINRK